MSKRKTRFTIETPTQVSELFSVRERSNGDLVLLLKMSNQVGDGHADTYDDLAENRISAHVSPNSQGRTFIHHVKTSEDYTRHYANVVPNGGSTAWPLIAVICADLERPHYASDPASRDTRHSLGFYNPRFSVLCYFVVISDRDQKIRPIQNMQSITVSFSVFSLHVSWAYLMGTSFHQGNIYFNANAISNESHDGQFNYSKAPSTISRSRGELVNWVRKTCAHMSASHCMKLERVFRNEGQALDPQFKEAARTFLHSPIIPDEQSSPPTH
jgi:hypothetical protein